MMKRLMPLDMRSQLFMCPLPPFGGRALSLVGTSMRLLLCSLVVVVLLPSCSTADSPDEAAVRAQLTRYFSTWSAKDMDGYGECFQEGARITFVQPGGLVSTEALTDFLHSQRMAHAQSPSPMKEEPTEMKILLGKGIAHATVKWKLTKDATVTTGTDMFTLARTKTGWRIVALVWEQD